VPIGGTKGVHIEHMQYCITVHATVMPKAEKLITYISVGKNLNIARLLCSETIIVCVHTPNHPLIFGHPAQRGFKSSLPYNQASDTKF
jgi:hypothetical protein